MDYDYGNNYVSDSSACFFIDSCVHAREKVCVGARSKRIFGRRKWIFLNIGVVPGTFLNLFCNFSCDTYIILPRDLLLLGILELGM
jgi:hypothetical protein